METLKHSEITGAVIKAFYKVYNTLGHGFLDKVYENALVVELRNSNLKVVQQLPVRVWYEETDVGEYYADLLVEESVIVEVNAFESIQRMDEAQLLNCLKATAFEVGLLLNFGSSAEYKRKIFDNELKRLRKVPDYS